MLSIVYDGECSFCLRSLSLCMRLARRPVFLLQDANDREAVGAKYPMLAGADVEDAMFAVTERGEVFRGFFAFRRMMWESPWLYVFLPVFYAPGASLVGPLIYAWVARHRASFGCASTCDLPDPSGPRPRPRG